MCFIEKKKTHELEESIFINSKLDVYSIIIFLKILKQLHIELNRSIYVSLSKI
jgi:hypothetical protein